MAKNEQVEMVKGSQSFEPTDARGGTLRWKERVTRPGWRPTIRERSIRKDYHLAPVNLEGDVASAHGDSQVA